MISKVNAQLWIYFSTLIYFLINNFQVSHLYKYDAVLIVYSITDRESFQFAKDVLSDITLKNNSKRPGIKRQHAVSNEHETSITVGSRPRIVILVGNKTDLERSRSVTTKGTVQ